MKHSCSPGSPYFLLAVSHHLQPFAIYSGAPQSVFALIRCCCLIPTTIGGCSLAMAIRRPWIGLSSAIVDAIVRGAPWPPPADVDSDAPRQAPHHHTWHSRSDPAVHPLPASLTRNWPAPRNSFFRRDETPEAAQSSSWTKENTGSADRELAPHNPVSFLFRANPHVRSGMDGPESQGRA